MWSKSIISKNITIRRKTMKKVRKTLAVIVLAFQTLSLTAGAATIDSFQYNAGNVTVKGTSGEEFVTYKVYDKGTSGTLFTDIYEMGETKVTDGEFEIEIKMPRTVRGKETDGEYVFAVMGDKQDSKEFVVIAYSSLEGFVKSVNGEDIASGADLVALFGATADGGYSNLDIMESLGADVDYYIGLDEEEEVFANAFFAENSEKTVTVETFGQLFENAKIVQYINKNKADATWLAESGFEFDGKEFSELDDEKLKTWILENVNSVITETSKYGKYAEIEKKYREANVLYKLNDAKHTEYEELIDSYNDVIEIIEEDYYQDYLDMKASYKNKVVSEVKNSITKTPVTNAEDFRDIYKAAVKKVKKSMNSSSSGGGGSSSSSGGMSVIVPEITNPIKAQSKFNDLTNVDWAKDAIEGLAAKGVVAGYDDNTFKPQKNITREEFIKMVVAAQGVRLNASPCELSDVDQNAWYAPYVNAAYQAGIVKGVSETEFGIGKEITREDMAVIIARLKNYAGTEVQGTFADEASIADYAKDAVYSLYNAGKIAGVGNNMFGPKQIVNRAQAAKIIYDTLFAGI